MIAVGVQSGFSQTAGNSESVVTLHRRVEGACELVQRGVLLAEGTYASLRVEGVTELVYSPELSKNDFIGYPTGTPQKLVKLARKSGFRTKPAPSTLMTELPKVVGLAATSICPSLEKALQAAEQERIERRKQVQSKVFRPSFDGVSRPEPIDTPRPTVVPKDANSSQSSHRAVKDRVKRRQETALLSVIVGSNGDVEQVKVVRSSSPQIDQDVIQGASKWKFRPARKNGLPVPAQINIELSLYLY